MMSTASVRCPISYRRITLRRPWKPISVPYNIERELTRRENLQANGYSIECDSSTGVDGETILG